MDNIFSNDLDQLKKQEWEITKRRSPVLTNWNLTIKSSS